MAWGFRKSLNLGPLRINASKSGLGYSFGGRGFRIGRDARGRKYTSTSIPGTGLYNRSYLKSTPKAPAARYTLPSRGNSAPSITKHVNWRALRTSAAYFLAATLLYLLISWFAHLM
ncbi:DUF4236 domain-containing protein [Terriglobus albidus]|uniref:DUF4236 domain-containing protein n=1 Tax=Terriglobus albidus TaxID=1592106 RepID=UPI0037D9FC29